MGAKIRIEHVPGAWIQIFKSAEMQSVVDAAGERIAAEAGDHFGYMPAQNSQFTAGGFVSSDEYTGAYEEAVNKTLTKAVHK